MKNKILSIILTICLISSCYWVVGAAETENNITSHQNLFLSENGFDRITNLANGELNSIWIDLQSYCDALGEPPAYYEDSNTEENWMREVGDNIFRLSLAYRISNDSKYLTLATQYVNTAISYPNWGRGSYLNNDLACAHLLIGISTYYDWLYDDLSANQRATVLAVLEEKSTAMQDGGWWKKSFLQNHSWVTAASMAITSVAIAPENPALSTSLFETASGIYARIFRYVSDEGSYHEGSMYMAYGLEHMLYFVNIAKNFYGIDYTNEPFLRNIGEFVINTTLPQMKNGSVVDTMNFADAPARNEPDFIAALALLADIINDSEIQTFVESYSENYNNKKNIWKLLITYDPNLETGSITYEKDKLYQDLGYCFSRSGWEKDDAVLAFKCGVPLGVETVGYDDSNLGTGHVHPDQNHFNFVFNGQRIFTDDGYTTSYTAGHNTLSIDGAGQYYEGSDHSDWKDSDAKYATPEVTTFTTGDNYMYAVGDATDSYDLKTTFLGSKLQKYKRHFLFVKPDVLIVIDDVSLKSWASSVAFQTNFFTDINYKSVTSDGVYLFDNDVVKFNITSVGDGTVGVQSIARTIDKNGKTQEQEAFTVSKSGKSMLQATAISLGKKWDEVKDVNLSLNNRVLTVEITSEDTPLYSQEFSINIDSESVSYEEHFPVTTSFDSATSTLYVEGELPFGTYRDVAIKFISPAGEAVYVNELQAEGKTFSAEIPVEITRNGVHKIQIYNPEYGSILGEDIPIEIDFEIQSVDVETTDTGAHATVKLFNNTNKEKTVGVYFASYVGGSMEFVDYKPVVISPNNEKEEELNLTDFDSSSNRSVKLFVLDTELTPLMKQVEKEVK